MRLLKIKNHGEFSLTDDIFDDDIPQYAILSHTWGPDTEEITFKHVVEGTGKSKAGYSKIRFCGEQAASDDLQYFWADTCCIDRSNNTELSEAINSMFRWYRNASRCYVYLSDVSIGDSDKNDQSTWELAFRQSRWFTRGWTLQELIAPASVEFFSLEGKRLGDKKSLERQIHEITGIPVQALQGNPLSRFSVTERISWAEKRETRRKEDKAYSLLGIFDIYMPLIYGEGRENAFIRLWQTIDKSSMDKSLALSPAIFSTHEDNFKYQESIDPNLQGRRPQESTITNNAGLSLGIPSLFSACMDILQRMEAYKDLRVEASHAIVQFDADKLRLQKWSKEVGISDGEWNQKRDPRLQDPDLEVVIKKILYSICEIFDATELTRSQLRIKSGPEDRPYPDLPDSFTEHANKENSSSLSKKGGIGLFIKHKGKFTNQVDMLKKIVDMLYNLVPPTKNLEPYLVRHVRDRDGSLKIQSNIQFLLEDAQRRAKEQAQIEINDWLDMTIFDQRHSVHQHYDKQLSSRLDGTCEWIFHTPEYITWASEDFPQEAVKFLWICGRAGYGKTVLCAKLIEYLKANHKSPVVFFFSSPRAASSGDLSFIIRSWIAQLTLVDSDAFELVRGYIEHSGGKRALDTDIWRVFDCILTGKRAITLLLDGFDEYSRVGDNRTEFLRKLKQSTAGKATRILISSREEIDIKAELSPETNQAPGQILLEHKIAKKDIREDVKLYSRSVVDKKLPKKDEILREKLANQLAERCDGMFLWIKMQQEQLRGGKSGKQLEKIVENMPLGLTETYERNWKSIRCRPPDEQDRAFAILRWTMFAFRPLSIFELSEALIVKSYGTCMSLQPEEMPDDIDDEYIDGEIIDICGSLVEVRKESGAQPGSATIHLVHSSVREFLLSALPTHSGELCDRPSAIDHTGSQFDHHSYLARVCLAFLNYDQVWDFSDDEQNPLHGHPFLEYAAKFWHSHMFSARRDDSRAFSMADEFFRLENKNFKKWAKYFETFEDAEDPGERIVGTPLYYAALFDLLPTMESIWGQDRSQLNTIGGQYGTPLQATCAKGNQLAFETLKRLGADPNVEGGQYGVALNAAAAGGRKDMVTDLVHIGAKLELQDSMERTALYTAAKNGFTEVVDFLLKAGSELRVRNKGGWTPISVAASCGHLEVVRLLLDRGADANTPGDNGYTPVISAAGEGHFEVVRLLLDRGAEANTPSNEGWTPVNSAAMNGHLEVVRLLLDRGADANTPNNNGWTPLNLAANNGHLEVMRLLLDRGTDANTPSNEGWMPVNSAATNGHLEVVRLLLDRGANANTPNNNGWTPVNLAANNGHLEVVRLLLDCGADANTPNNEGWTPVKSAANNGRLEVVRVLSLGVDVSAADERGFTPLHGAVMKDLATAKLLYESGADINTRSKTGRTPLYEAAASGKSEIVQWLLSLGADVSAADEDGFTPLHSAVQTDLEIVKLLHDAGADISSRTKTGQTPLHRAASAGQLQVTEWLINVGQSLNAMDILGRTPLHLAVYRGMVSTVQLLLSRHANAHLRDGYGKSSFEWIQLNQHLRERVSNLLTSPPDVQLNSATHHLRQSIRILSSRLLDNNGQPIWPGYHSLGNCLIYLQESAEALTAYEQQILAPSNDSDVTHDVTCDICKSYLIRGVRYVCLTCPDSDLCGSCRSKYNESVLSNGCCEHEFMSVPGPAFAGQNSNIVNASGETRITWLKRIKDTFGVSLQEYEDVDN